MPGSVSDSPFPPPWLLAALQGIRQARFDQDVWLWVAGFLVLYVVVTNLFWFVPALRPWSRGTPLLVGRFFGFATPPYLALQAGLVTTSAMGLAHLDWLRPFGAGLVAAAALLGLIALAAWHYRRWAANSETAAAVRLATPAQDDVPVLLVPFLAAAEQLYWALVRVGSTAFLVMAGAQPDASVYWGAWLGVGLLVLTWLANTAWRHTVRSPAGGYAELLRLCLAVASTALFVLSGNLWVSWVFHVTGWWIAQLAQARVRRSVQHATLP